MARRKTIDELKANSIKYEQKAKAAKEALEKEVRLEEERMDKRFVKPEAAKRRVAGLTNLKGIRTL